MQKQHKKMIQMLLAVLILLLGAASVVVAGAEAPEDKVAVVNGTVITKLDFDVEMNRAQQQLARSGQPVSDVQLAAVKRDVLENLINRELLYQEGKKKGATVDEATIDKELAAFRGRFSNDEQFKDALSKMNLSEANVRAEIERGMTVQQFVDKEFGGKITITDKESKGYYDSNTESFKQSEQVCARHILIKVDPEAEKAQKAEARKTVKGIQKRIKKGEDFGALAKEFSTCPSSKKGGDLGCFGRGQMVKPFEEAAFALEPGKVSGIVESQFGYHLIKVTEKKPAGIMAYAEVKDRLQQYLKQEKIQEELNIYVEKLKKDGKIERFLPEGP